MPAVIYLPFQKLLFDLLLKKVVAPTTLYMGLLAGSQEIGTTDGSGHLSGYARQATAGTDAAGGGGEQLSFGTVSFPAFTAPPSPNGGTDWFIADALTGGNTLFSGPLNPFGVTGTLSAALAVNATSFSVPAATASQINIGDVLALGSACGKNLEYVTVSAVGAASGGTATLTITATTKAHPSGEAWFRDRSAPRYYSAGFVETVTAVLQLSPG